jgi:beta-mannosidase
MDFVSIVSINDLLPGFPHFVLIKKIYNQSDKQITSPILKKYSRPLHTIDLIINEMRKTKLNPSYLSGFMYYNGVLTSQMFENKILPFRFDYKYNGYICGFYNDYAPVISKSAVDFNGIWKAKMFSVKRIFEKLQFKITENSGKVDVSIRSDFTENITVDFYFKLYNLKGNVVWRKNFYNISIKSNSFQNYFNFNFLNELNKTKRNNTVLKIEVYYDKELFSEKYHYFVPDDELKLIAPNINKKYFRIDDGYVIELTTDYLAKNVYIYTEKDGILSDNYFDIIPGETKKIIYYTKTDIYAIESVFKISSFTDIYNFGLFSL